MKKNKNKSKGKAAEKQKQNTNTSYSQNDQTNRSSSVIQITPLPEISRDQKSSNKWLLFTCIIGALVAVSLFVIKEYRDNKKYLMENNPVLEIINPKISQLEENKPIKFQYLLLARGGRVKVTDGNFAWGIASSDIVRPWEQWEPFKVFTDFPFYITDSPAKFMTIQGDDKTGIMNAFSIFALNESNANAYVLGEYTYIVEVTGIKKRFKFVIKLTNDGSYKNEIIENVLIE